MYDADWIEILITNYAKATKAAKDPWVISSHAFDKKKPAIPRSWRLETDQTRYVWICLNLSTFGR